MRIGIREFHDALIGSGPMPLEMLERRTRRWSEQSSATDTACH